jgi:LysR family transcriptional regulator, cys regulon transcriptional activator
MNLLQLQIVVAITDSGLSISGAADVLELSQPALSKQLIALEKELGLHLFDRRGKRLERITPAGEEVLGVARRVLGEITNIQAISGEFKNAIGGALTIATTHTQARYVLPAVIEPFMKRYPACKLALKQGTPQACAALVASGQADIAIATEALADHPDLATLPVYDWNRVLVVPKGHALAAIKKPKLAEVALHPLITYDGTFTGRSKIDAAFRQAGLLPNVVLTALDSDIIKTYVRLGLGVGIIAQMAVEPKRDDDLVAIDASHLFAASTTRVGLRRGSRQRLTVFEFIGHFAPQLTRKQINAAIATAKPKS